MLRVASVSIAALAFAALLCLVPPRSHAADAVAQPERIEPGRALVFELGSPRALREWKLLNAGRVSFRGGAAHIDSSGSYLMLSPELSGGRADAPPTDRASALGSPGWGDFRYVVIDFADAPEDGRGKLVWSPDGNLESSPVRSFALRAGAGVLVLDVGTPEPWHGSGIWQGPIGRFGLKFDAASAIRSVRLQQSLTLGQWGALLVQSWSRREIFLPSSINFLYGPWFHGHPVVLYFGCGVVVLGLLALALRKGRAFGPLLLVIALCFVALDLQFQATLFDQLRRSFARSAWYADPYAENASRYGVEFADLVREFEARVPRGAKVFFPRERRWWTLGETNRIAFRLHPDYVSVAPEVAEYVFYYHPNDWVYGSERGFEHRGGELRLPAQELHRASDDARILRRLHD